MTFTIINHNNGGATMLFVTIGESPRDDVIPELIEIIGKKDLVYNEIGLIDGVDSEEYRPKSNEEFLVSKRKDGTTAYISHEWVAKKLSQMHFEDLAVLLCTAKFEDDRLILPYKVIRNFLTAMPKINSMTVVVPDKGQCEEALKRWEKVARRIQCIAFSPYSAVISEQNLKDLKGEQLVYLDCMGFTLEHERVFKRYTAGIVLSARRILGNYLRILL